MREQSNCMSDPIYSFKSADWPLSDRIQPSMRTEQYRRKERADTRPYIYVLLLLMDDLYDEPTIPRTSRRLKKRTGSSCARCKVNWLSVRDVHETMTRWQGDIGTGQHHLADP